MTLRDLLGVPAFYRAFQSLVGARRARDRFVRDHVRARPGDVVVDIGCGPGDLAACFREQRYVGFDPNGAYIDAARRTYPHATFTHASVESFEPGDLRADLVLAVGVLHHLDDEEARMLLTLARRCLKPGGRLVTLDGCYTDEQGVVARQLLRHDRGRHVRTADGYRRLLGAAFEDVRATVRTDLLTIPYTHFIAESTQASAEPQG